VWRPLAHHASKQQQQQQQHWQHWQQQRQWLVAAEPSKVSSKQLWLISLHHDARLIWYRLCYRYNREGFSSEGYDRQGYNSEGYNSEGYTREHVHKDGYNEAGMDSKGYSKDPPHLDQYGYDRFGFRKTADGLVSALGYFADGKHKDG
jgi:hypothetical protein